MVSIATWDKTSCNILGEKSYAIVSSNFQQEQQEPILPNFSGSSFEHHSGEKVKNIQGKAVSLVHMTLYVIWYANFIQNCDK